MELNLRIYFELKFFIVAFCFSRLWIVQILPKLIPFLERILLDKGVVIQIEPVEGIWLNFSLCNWSPFWLCSKCYVRDTERDICCKFFVNQVLKVSWTEKGLNQFCFHYPVSTKLASILTNFLENSISFSSVSSPKYVRMLEVPVPVGLKT